MADSDFPHLTLLHKVQGQAKFPKAPQSNDRVDLNKQNRSYHGGYLANSFSDFGKRAKEIRADRAQRGLPEIAAGVPFLLQIPDGDDETLASSVHLVVRPRITKGDDAIGDWRDVLEELPKRIHAWLPRLAEEGVVGADAIFACLGPALEIFSRYDSVEKASGEVVPLREYLEHVWAAVSREALSTVVADADLSGFESDARLSAMWLWTVAASPNGNDEEDEEVDTAKIKPVGFALEYDAARKIAQGLGANLDDMKSIVEV